MFKGLTSDYTKQGFKMWGNVQCCLMVVLILSVDWTVGIKDQDHDHDHSADHHQHLHHGNDAAHPHNDGEDKPCHKLSPHNADFAFSLYKKLASQPDTQGKNIFFSPLSISMALSMLALGAKGNTHSQIFSTLDYSALTSDQVNDGYEHLFRMLDHNQDALLLEIGGAAAVQKGFKPEDKFLKDIQHFYKGEAFSVDFSTPDVAVQEINKLIAKKTKDMITDMVKSLDAATVMMLINYVYFKGKWEEAFKVEETSKGDFHVDENTTVPVDMMNRNGEYEFYYDQGNFTSIIMLPYNGNASMMIILPDQGKMEELEKHISKDHLKYWKDKVHKITLDLYMPKFSVSASSCLGDTLKDMGMVDAFSDSADFSGISKGAKLAVSKVLHKAVLSVDEQGTQAAAATTVEIVKFSALLFKTEVNRPFLVFIVEKNTRSILFMGKITDPTVYSKQWAVGTRSESKALFRPEMQHHGQCGVVGYITKEEATRVLTGRFECPICNCKSRIEMQNSKRTAAALRLLPCSCTDIHTRPESFTWYKYNTNRNTWEMISNESEQYRNRVHTYN
ncbi:hypothetical protein P4O66_023111 [Electrophorus voltai]|uniref:Serpin domain-containing protein n=1 Tax=Electrophorus voltai TaxID=2609070 RepID=A0AAD9DKW9_9TELE|nr:hypothetical protein P4O66_023111 [Electrophorus voltai]